MPRLASLTLVALLLATGAWGQSAGPEPVVRELAWQAMGGRTVDLQLAGLAGGAVVDVAFSSDAGRLMALTARGDLWATADLGETWRRVASGAEALRQLGNTAANTLAPGEVGPPQEVDAVLRRHPFDSRFTFALGKDLHRSSDGGRTWVNLTADGAGSIIGPHQRAIAFSPADPDLIVVANARGLWRSADGGLTWSDLNRNIPNLPEGKIWRASDASELRMFLRDVGVVESDATGHWQPARDDAIENSTALAAQLPAADRQRTSRWPLDTPPGWALSYRVWRGGSPGSADLTACGTSACTDPERHFISAFGSGTDARPNFYAGTSDGHLWVSADSGRTWQAAMGGFLSSGNPVTGIFVSPRDSRVALAVLGGRGAGHVFRTTNGGVFWDDISNNLPDAPVRALAANAETGSIYVASEGGVFYTRGDLRAPGPATRWTRLAGNLPDAPVEDIRLNTVTGTLTIAVAGYGVFRATVPDIADSLRVLNAADLTSRAAAPGGLLTVIGAPVRAARAGGLNAPVLATGTTDSQIQVPFEASGPTLDLSLDTRLGSTRVGLPLEAVSPAIFVDADGSPLVLDAGSGLLLDSSRPARAGSQVLILSTGLGRVRPEWPTGLAAPLENPPATVAPVTAFLNGAPIPVVSSTLAAGYIGVYMVRAELPSIINSGTAEITIASGDKTSNKVRMFLEP